MSEPVNDPVSDQPELLSFSGAPEWDAWLSEHHARHPRVWLRIAKRHSGLALIQIKDALDVALCHGWIDGQRKALDDTSFRQSYSPRSKYSSWSQINVVRVEELIAEGRMRPGGFAEIARAQADGRWAGAYEAQRTATAPDDLVAALAENHSARQAFDALGKSRQYVEIIMPLLKARTPQSRATVLARAIAKLSA